MGKSTVGSNDQLLGQLSEDKLPFPASVDNEPRLDLTGQDKPQVIVNCLARVVYFNGTCQNSPSLHGFFFNTLHNKKKRFTAVINSS
jgi:hypothetical protein